MNWNNGLDGPLELQSLFLVLERMGRRQPYSKEQFYDALHAIGSFSSKPAQEQAAALDQIYSALDEVIRGNSDSTEVMRQSSALLNTRPSNDRRASDFVQLLRALSRLGVRVIEVSFGNGLTAGHVMNQVFHPGETVYFDSDNDELVPYRDQYVVFESDGSGGEWRIAYLMVSLKLVDPLSGIGVETTRVTVEVLNAHVLKALDSSQGFDSGEATFDLRFDLAALPRSDVPDMKGFVIQRFRNV